MSMSPRPRGASLLVAAAAVVGTLVFGQAPASAAGPATITVDDGPTSLTITTDKPMAGAQVAALKQDLRAGVRDTTAAAANPPVISCREGVRFFTDSKGTASFRFNCAYKNVNWGFKIAPKLQGIAVGPVAESGAIWYRNGKYEGKNSPHSVPAWYHFHGTFFRILKGDTVSWYDTYTFRCTVGVNCKAVLKVGGTFVVKK